MPDTKEARALVKLLPEQIAANWRKFRPIIRETLPPELSTSNKAIKQVLQSLLGDRGNMWMYRRGNKLVGMIVTTIDVDRLSGARSLLVYSLYSFGGVDKEALDDCIETLAAHARDMGINQITGYSKNKMWMRYLSQHQDADVDTHFIKVDI